jgi:hypothetical protein
MVLQGSKLIEFIQSSIKTSQETNKTDLSPVYCEIEKMQQSAK